MKNCKNCGKEMTGKYNIKFCSNRCSTSYNSIHPTKNVLESRKLASHKCLVCDKRIEGWRKTCSDQCKIIYENNPQEKINGIRCSICHEIKNEKDFYFIKTRQSLTSDCKSCNKQKCTIARIAFKTSCLKYKGGKCIKCGYNQCIAALDFHHRDDLTKEFGIGKCNHVKLSDVVKLELDKCDLLCSNCHREIHFKYEEGRGGTEPPRK